MAAAAPAATALLLETSDMTRGPELIPAMRQASTALYELTRRQFADDALYLVVFSYLAHEVAPEDLAQHSWPGGQPWAAGTNMQHALRVARDLLGRHPTARREVIMLTAGVPTACGAGPDIERSYPPTMRTVAETLDAMAACARE